MGVRNLIETISTDGETWEVRYACKTIGIIRLVKDEGPSMAKWLTGQTEWFGVDVDGVPLSAFRTLPDAVNYLVGKYIAIEGI